MDRALSHPGLRIGEDPPRNTAIEALPSGANDIRAKMGGDGSQSRGAWLHYPRAMMSIHHPMPSSAKRLATVVLPPPIPL